MKDCNYEIISTDGRAKHAKFTTVHGEVHTPLFMNVATVAAIKGAVSTVDLKEIDTQVALANTYHLHVRTGDKLIKELGGLHKFMNWDKPILTDSGGFQVYSLSKLRNISEEGVKFASQADREYMQRSVDRTTRWLVRSRDEINRLNSLEDTINKHQLLFGINQGGVYTDIRIEHAKTISELDLPGYALGGLAVGETHEEMYNVLDETVPYLPKNKPTYLMGVGTPENLLEAVDRGVDFFDCVYPSRNGRHGHVYTKFGKINMLNKKHEKDMTPIEEGCGCEACRNYSKAYIRHLLKAGEMLGLRLCVMHNLYFYNHLMEDIRTAIDEQRYSAFKKERIEMFRSGENK